MKIVQLLPELNEGGVERGVVELSCELVKKGFESIVVSSGGRLVEELERDGALHVELDVCSKNPLSAVFRVFELRKALKRLNPDVLHVRSRVPAWLVYFANKSLKIPLVSTVHGFNSVSFYSKIMTKADRVICVSGAIKEHIQKHYDADKSKITIIPRGVDLVKFNPDSLDEDFMDEFKKRFDLGGKFVVSTVGRITQLKDLETFVEAIAIVQKELPNVVGLIVGGVRKDKQSYFETLKNLVKSLHVNIVFTGSQAKVAEIYALSDVVTSTSKKPESFGRSVAEALAVNTPVIATNHGGVLDIIAENRNGFFVEVGDEEEFAKRIVEARGLSFDGYSYIEDRFSLRQMVDKTAEVYKATKKELHVCIFISNPMSKLAGLEKHFIDLANGLSRLVRVTALADKTYHPLLNTDIHVIDPKISSSRYNPLNHYKLYRILKNSTFTTVHSQANKATYFMSKIKRFFPKIKFIATLHNRKNSISFFDEMDHVIGVSDFVTKQVANTQKTTIYNGLDKNTIDQASKINLQKEFNITNSFPIATSVGRLVEAKGFSTLIDAIKPLDINLIIVGDGALLESLKEQVKKNLLQDRVFFAGFREDALTIIKSSDLVVIASKNEGFSYVFAEALMLKRPLISTDVADIKRFIPASMLCKTDDCKELREVIEKFLYNNADMDKYYADAIEIFDIETMIDKTLNLYNKTGRVK